MAGHTVIEIARFEGNEDYAKNPHIIDEAFAIVAQTKGCNAYVILTSWPASSDDSFLFFSIWHGLQEEENRVWLVLCMLDGPFRPFLIIWLMLD